MGIQYWHVYGTGSGALPLLCWTSTSAADVDKGPLNAGYAGRALSAPPEGMKPNTALIASTSIGDTTVTLKNAGDKSKIKVGRWHIVCSQCIQIGGFPSNCAWVEYVRVTAVSGTTVTLDRKLHYAHLATHWEDPSDDGSWGMARLVPFDTGGTGGYVPSDPCRGRRTSSARCW
jgi:hypothetical protein